MSIASLSVQTWTLVPNGATNGSFTVTRSTWSISGRTSASRAAVGDGRPEGVTSDPRGRNTGPGKANTARPATGLMSSANAIHSEMAPRAMVQMPTTTPSHSPPPRCLAMRAM